MSTRVIASSLLDRDEHLSGRDLGSISIAVESNLARRADRLARLELPRDSARAAAQIRAAFSRAKGGEGVEIGCIGGLGRTGTVLACVAVLAGVDQNDAVDLGTRALSLEAAESRETKAEQER